MHFDIFTGFLVGLSSGAVCLGICSPYLIPFLLAEKRDIKNNTFIILEFLSGRLIAYISVAIFAGVTGVALNDFIISSKITGGFMIIAGVMLFLYSSGIANLIKIYPLKNISIRVPFGAGLVSGLNICPPFITAFTYAVSLHSIINSLIYFLFFFLGTSVYLLPFIFSGLISKYKTAQNAGKISGILVSLFVIINGILLIFRG
jgi:sulfite exporter TauE/SafE